MSEEHIDRKALRDGIRSKMHFYHLVSAVPVILKYGDTIWKKDWLKYRLIDLPGGRDYCDDAILLEPQIKSKRGQMVTVDKTGLAFHGIGVVAANLTLVNDADRVEALKLVLDSDPDIAGIAYITKDNYILDWIDREHAANL